MSKFVPRSKRSGKKNSAFKIKSNRGKFHNCRRKFFFAFQCKKKDAHHGILSHEREKNVRRCDEGFQAKVAAAQWRIERWGEVHEMFSRAVAASRLRAGVRRNWRNRKGMLVQCVKIRMEMEAHQEIQEGSTPGEETLRYLGRHITNVG